MKRPDSMRARVMVGSLALAGLIVGGVVAWSSLRPDLMMVEHIEFQGHSRASDTALRHLADVRNGTTIWDADAAAVQAGVQRHPWVRAANARVVWPDRIVVEIEEYEPVALVHLDKLYYADSYGTLFHATDGDDLDYPSITGITPELIDAHPDLPGLVIQSALKLVDALDTRGLVGRDAISEIHFRSTRGFTVYTGRSEVVFGLDRHEEQVNRLASLLQDGVSLGEPTLVDLAPASVAIVRPLDAGGEG